MIWVFFSFLSKIEILLYDLEPFFGNTINEYWHSCYETLQQMKQSGMYLVTLLLGLPEQLEESYK